jgi:rubrerythrin
MRYYNGDPSDLDGLTREEVEDRTHEHYFQAEDSVEDMLDEIYPEVTIGSMSWTAGVALRRLDEIAFRCTVADLVTEVDLDDYPSEDDEDEDDDDSMWCEDCGHILDPKGLCPSCLPNSERNPDEVA